MLYTTLKYFFLLLFLFVALFEVKPCLHVLDEFIFHIIARFLRYLIKTHIQVPSLHKLRDITMCYSLSLSLFSLLCALLSAITRDHTSNEICFSFIYLMVLS